MMQNVKPGIYEHYKGKEYRVLDVFKHSETLEEFVAYECLHENKESQYWIRPLSRFLENIEINGVVTPRFRYIRAEQ